MTENRVIEGELTVGGRARAFALRLPSKSDNRETTVVLVLHGDMPGTGGESMCRMTTFDQRGFETATTQEFDAAAEICRL